MLSKQDLKHYQDILIKNEDRIILAIGFVLVAILSFGAGKLSEVQQGQTPIIFQDTANCPKSQGLSADNQGGVITEETAGQIIGNKNSRIYHLPGGSFYGKISAENRVYFATEADAQKAGYRKAKN